MEKQEFNYILCKTVSGEGYSEPEFTIYDSHLKALKELQGEINNYKAAGFLVNETSYEFDYGFQTEKEDTDYHRMQIIKVPKKEFYLLRYKEPNEVEVIRGENAIGNCTYLMAESIRKTNWSKSEEKWDGKSLVYGAYTDDQDYVGYQILSSSLMAKPTSISIYKNDSGSIMLTCENATMEQIDMALNEFKKTL